MFYGFLTRFSWYSERTIRTNIKLINNGHVAVEKTKILHANAVAGQFSFIDGSALCRYVQEFVERHLFAEKINLEVIKQLVIVVQLLDNFSMRSLSTVVLCADRLTSDDSHGHDDSSFVSETSLVRLERIISL
jgi:hypothetical protein